MDRFYHFWNHHFAIEPQARQYLSGVIQLRSYTSGELFTHAGEAKRYWCFVLSGMAARVVDGDTNKAYYHWITGRHGYFSGTAHPFTQRPAPHPIQFLRSTSMILLPTHHFQYAQQHFISFGELVQTLKQQQIDANDILRDVLASNEKEKYAAFRQHMPQWHAALDDQEQMRLLRVKRSSFYAGKAAYGRGQR